MTYIRTTAASQASAEVLEFYRRQQGGLDYLPNYARVFCHRPQVMQAWAELQSVLRGHLDARAYGLVTLAAALAIHSSYCALAHAGKLLKHYFTQQEMIAIIRGGEDSPLSTAEKAMMQLARKVALNASTVSAADIQLLRDAGFTEAGIFDVVAAAAARCFFAKVPDALGVRPDAALGELEEPLLSMLVVGRLPATGI